jgi:predicted RNA-binding Zn ribbon-like protein
MLAYITAMAGDTPRDGVRELRFDAGSLSLNLVGTVARRLGDPIERLTSLEVLERWLRGVGLLVDARLADGDLRQLRTLREQLDGLYRDLLDGNACAASTVASVNEAAAACPPQLATEASPPALAAAPAGCGPLARVLALIAADAIRIVTGPERERLRRCEAGDCGMVYLASGRGPRRWCSSQRCGNRMRVAAHRARAADAPTSSDPEVKR